MKKLSVLFMALALTVAVSGFSMAANDVMVNSLTNDVKVEKTVVKKHKKGMAHKAAKKVKEVKVVTPVTPITK